MKIIYPNILYFIAKNIVVITVVQIVAALTLGVSLYKKIFEIFSTIQNKAWYVLAYVVFLGALLCVCFMLPFSF